MPQNINIDINALLYALGTFVGGLFIVLWYLIRQKFKDIDNKRDKEACDIIHKTTDEKIIRRINELDVKLTNKFFPNLGIENSPYRPSDTGKKLLQDSGWDKIYHNIETKDEIFGWIDKENPKALYDVERSAFYVLQKNKDNDKFAPLKEYVVNNPEKELSVIFVVASWVIRDEYWDSR